MDCLDSNNSDDARNRLLDAAEAVFAQNGFEGASLRAITKAADMNVAAVNYYFGTKESLFMEVVRRRIEPINTQRRELLQRYRAEGNGALTVDRVIRALLWPMAKMSADRHALRLMGRCMTERVELQRQIYEAFFWDIGKEFVQALGQAMPRLSRTELMWRFHFAVSLMVGALIQHERLAYLLPKEYERVDAEGMLRRLADYMRAGLEAPAHGEEKAS